MRSYFHERIFKAVKGFFDKPETQEDEELTAIPPRVEEWAERNTLVGVLRYSAQLDIALKNNFYHIPAKYLSEYDLPIKYVAIYQSKNLFKNKAGIYYYGEVKSCSCVKRSLITEAPKNSNEYYYRFDVKEWKTLENPIEAKEVAFIRLFTNYDMMLNSTETPQLLLKNKEIHTIYTDIKNAISQVQNNPETEPPVLHFGDYSIMVELDDLFIFKGVKPINSFSTYDFMDLPNTIMTQIYKYIRNGLQ